MIHRTLRISSFLLLLSSLTILGCKSKETTVAQTAVSNSTVTASVSESPAVLASIERTACFGKCPIYRATFHDNGEVTYIGRNFVEHVGTYTTLISEDDLKSIVQMAKDMNYFGLNDAYPTPIPDFPTCITTVNLEGRQKRILNGENAPRDLIGFERHLDALLKDREWTKVSDVSRY